MKPIRQLASFFIPSHYELTLDVSKRPQKIFSGHVLITGTLPQDSHTITLHAKDLHIVTATIDGTEATVAYGNDDELTLSAKKIIPAGEHSLQLHFEGTITDNMGGIYTAHYKQAGQDKEMLVTQFESHSAREAFPCIDEPAAKATFDITLITEIGLTVLGNMPVTHQAEKNGVMFSTFQTTPKMSTYLVAFTVGELNFVEAKSRSGVTVRTYATANNVQHATFATELAAKTLDFMDDFFGLPFPLPKCDIVCVPDFSALAMENWGLIIGRELAFLINVEHSAAATKQLAAQVIVHELAHQWFGNLVTMQWWDDLWLNESFAKWMEDYGVDHFYPNWHMWEQFKQTEQNIAFTRDSLADVQAVRQPVHHPDELHSLFDPAIVYAKGASLILMLQHFIGMDAFKKGLQAYMQAHKYSNATVDDLWTALESASGKNVRDFMLPWLTQPGHPVVQVKPVRNAVTLSQKRFFANPAHKSDATVWPIPTLSPQLQVASLATANIKLVPTEQPVHLNAKGGGFYHTQYPADTLELLIGQIKDGALPPLDFQTLIIDTLQLCRSGAYGAIDLLRIVEASKMYDSYAIWQAVAIALESLKQIINEDQAAAPYFRRFIAAIVQSQYNRLGWEQQSGESHFDTLMRPLIIGLMIYSDDPGAVKKALALFDAVKQPNNLPAELRTTIIATAMRERGVGLFDTLFEWYTHASAEERVQICGGIVAAKDSAVATRATALFTTKAIKPQDLRSWYGFMVRNPYLRPQTWDWAVSHWDWIEHRFKGGHELGDFPKYIAMGMVTRQELNQYRTFFESKTGRTELARPIAQGIDDIEARAAWRDRDLKAIAAYLT